MDVIKYQKGYKNYLTFKAIGGIFNFRFILSDSPWLLLQLFHVYIGQSEIPPFWSLGFHQSRWGYSSVYSLKQVVQQFQRNNLPLDGIWTDIDYMINYEDFTIDEKNFPPHEMSQLISEGYHYIPVLNPGVGVSGPVYQEGK